MHCAPSMPLAPILLLPMPAIRNLAIHHRGATLGNRTPRPGTLSNKQRATPIGYSALRPCSVGLVVVDVDTKHKQTNEPLPFQENAAQVVDRIGAPVCQVKSRSGGLHLFYRLPEDIGAPAWYNLAGEWAGDIRSSGFIVLWDADAVAAALECLDDYDPVDKSEWPFRKEERRAAASGVAGAVPTEELRSLLAHIEPVGDRTEWVKLTAAFKEAGGDYALFDDWAKQGAGYDPDDNLKIWNSVNGTGHGNPSTRGTLFHRARENGWQATHTVIGRNSWGFDKALQHLGMELRLNKRSDAIQWRAGKQNWQDLQGRFRSYTRVRISEELCFENKEGKQYPAMFGKDTFDVFIEARSVAKTVDPFKQWLMNLPAWDGRPRIATMLKEILPAKHPELGAWAAQALITGAIARTFEPGREFSTFPLFIGHIGIGKSLIGKLLPPDERFYTDSLQVSATDKECIEQAGEVVIVELAELAGLTKRDTEHFKAFATRTVDTARLAFRTDSSKHPRHWVCYGTSNFTSRGALLDDESGNRRVLVVVVGPENSISADKQAMCGKRIVEYMNANRDQLWAEGLHLFRTTDDTRSLYAPTAYHWQLQKKDEEEATQRDDFAEELAEFAQDELWAKEGYVVFEHLLVKKGIVNPIMPNSLEPDTPGVQWVSTRGVQLRQRVSRSLLKRGFKRRRKTINGQKRTVWEM